MSIVALLLHAAVMSAAAFVLAGLIPRIRAQLAGQAAAPALQVLHDWRRLLRKSPVVTEAASPLLRAAPPLCLVATAAAALLVPSFTTGMATAPASDLLVITGLLALCRVVRALAAIDTGTAAAGFAGAGTMRVGLVAFPALLLALFAVAVLAGTTNLAAAIAALRDAPAIPAVLAVAALAVAVVALDAEDDPSAAELSGWHAAASEAAAALRRVVLLSLVAGLVLPGSMAAADSGLLAWAAGLGAWVLKLALLSAVCAFAGPALRRTGQVGPALGAALLLALLAVLFLFAGQTFA